MPCFQYILLEVWCIKIAIILFANNSLNSIRFLTLRFHCKYISAMLCSIVHIINNVVKNGRGVNSSQFLCMFQLLRLNISVVLTIQMLFVVILLYLLSSVLFLFILGSIVQQDDCDNVTYNLIAIMLKYIFWLDMQ